MMWYLGIASNNMVWRDDMFCEKLIHDDLPIQFEVGLLSWPFV